MRSTIALFASSRRLGKTGFVVCSSVYDAPCPPFINAFRDTFDYLGMHFGGCINANCKEGYKTEQLAAEVAAFQQLLQR